MPWVHVVAPLFAVFFIIALCFVSGAIRWIKGKECFPKHKAKKTTSNLAPSALPGYGAGKQQQQHDRSWRLFEKQLETLRVPAGRVYTVDSLMKMPYYASESNSADDGKHGVDVPGGGTATGGGV
jgi:hypothetical protein